MDELLVAGLELLSLACELVELDDLLLLVAGELLLELLDDKLLAEMLLEDELEDCELWLLCDDLVLELEELVAGLELELLEELLLVAGDELLELADD